MRSNFPIAIVSLVLFSIVTFSCTNTEQQQSKAEPEKIINTFFVKYETNGPSAAIDYVFSTNSSTDSALARKIDELKYQLNSNIPTFGEYNGHELITQKSIGDNFVLYSYIVKYSRQPIRFTFLLYNPKNKWSLYKFASDTELESELEDAGKIYFLK